MRVAVIFALALVGCAGEFHPDLAEDESGSEEGTTASDPSGSASLSSTSVATTDDPSSGSPTTASTQGGEGGPDTNPVSDSSSEDSSDASTNDEGSTGSSDAPPGCGDGAQEADEECDGSDLAGQTCVSRGMPGGGSLGCFDDCTFDVSACSLGGDQPEDGMWSSCVSYEDCPVGPSWECEDNFCSIDCETVADCGPSPGGTAVAECRPLSPENPEQGGRCYLNCENGESCPTGMVCWGASYCRSMT